MFGNLFTSKEEKAFKAAIPMGSELEISYTGIDTHTISQLLKVDSKSVTLLGFRGKLRSKEISVKVLRSGMSFETVIRRAGSDKNGNPLFYCDFPKKLNRASKPVQIYKIYPSESQAKILISTNRGEKSVVFPIWEVSEFGISLVNKANIGFKIGTKFFQAMVTVGSLNGQLINMQVAKLRNEKTPDGVMQVLTCVWTDEPRALSEILSQGKSLAPKPKPKPKK